MKPASQSGKGDPAPGPSARTKAVPPSEPPRRAFTARSLSALMPSVTRAAFRKQSPASVRLFLEWDSAIGPAYANRTMPRKLAGGTLTIACLGPAAMELQHMQTMLIDRINTWSGHKLVERLRLTQDMQPPPRRKAAQRKQQIASITIADMPEGPLRDALEQLGTSVGTRRRGN